MPESVSEILAEIIRLTHSLPDDPAAYADFSASKRRRLRVELETAILKLNSIARSMDLIRQPKHVFDPTSPQVIGKIVADALLLQDREKLSDAVKQSFYGAGVYAIYYRGPFDSYQPISKKDHPIYVGKADPDELHALTPEAQGARLFGRLKDHHRSLSYAQNLDIADFDCRYLVVRSAWVETAEDLLIDRFKPVWNNETKVCYGFGKHGDRAETRANERSPWDTLHPGRPWATSEANTPNKRGIEKIKADIAAHFEQNPPKG